MDKTLDRALDLLGALAVRLGTTVEHLWPVLIRQAVAEGLVFLLVGGGIGAALAYASRRFYLGRQAVKAREENRYDEDDLKLGLMIGCILTGAAAATILPLTVSAGILHLANPEFYALRYILGAIGGGK